MRFSVLEKRRRNTRIISTYPTIKRRLPIEKARANFCGLRARIGGVRKRKENIKQTADPARQAKNPKNLNLINEQGVF